VKLDDQDRAAGGQLGVSIHRVNRGTVGYLAEGGGSLRVATLTLPNDGVEWVEYGTSAHLFYFRSGRYRMVWTAD
jgi:hypothetical protein